MQTVLTTKHVGKTFLQGTKKIIALENISASFMAGKFTAICGRSGSGKSTLLTILAGLDRPSSGEVFFLDRRIDDLPEDNLAEIRKRQIGFVFQSFHLVPALTALENVALPLELQGRNDAKEAATALLKKIGLAERLNSFSHQLSGGEQQRVAIARALIAEPKVLFADEPTGNLDAENREAILDLLLALQKEQGTALIMVTHESSIAERADRVLTLEDGKIIHDTAGSK